jgi:hypothetical protein
VNLDKRFALTVTLATLAGLTAVGASAQTITQATFTLPTQTYWNDVLLQPGEYTLTLDRSLAGIQMVHVRGEGASATFLTPAGSEESFGRSCFKVDEVNGTYIIREFDSGLLGRSYRFRVSKAAQNRLLSGAAAQPATVPVSTVAGM